MRENKGFSLVELLVGIAIAAIVSASIGFLLTTSLRMYNKETVDVTLQQELQVTVNQIMDYAMESETIVADFDGTYPDYLALGTFKSKSGAKANDKTTIDSQIIWLDGNKLYLKKAEITDFCLSTDADSDDYRKINVSKIIDLIPDEGASEDINLLAQYVTGFSVSGVGGIVDVLDADGNPTGEKGYENPISIILKIEFEKTAATANREKRVEDTVYLRNRVTNDIYVNIAPDQLDKTYSLVNDNSVSIETTTVEIEKQAGIIQIPGTNNGGNSEDLNILEIVPEYSYDYVQYVIGGTNGSLLNTTNTTYGDSAVDETKGRNFTPITAAEFEGYFVRAVGRDYTMADHNDIYTNYYPNDHADMPALCFSLNKPRVGYYEYVGEENGGIYAIDSVTTKQEVANSPGYGNTKPNIKFFVSDKDSWRLDSYYTGKHYKPVVEYVDPQNVPSDTYFYPITATETAGGDYNKVIIRIDEWNTKEYYEYVGTGNGAYTVKLGYPQTTYGYANYKLVGEACNYFVGEGGDYYGVTEGDWEYREDSSSKIIGYDYDKNIEEVVMYSKYHTLKSSETPALSSDFGWIWHEETSGDLFNSITNDEKVTSFALVDANIYKNYVSPSDFNRIYLKNHMRTSVFNNDTFKLFVMQNALEMYTPNLMMDIKHGLWDTDNDTYCGVNKDALEAWEKYGHKITLNVRIPSDLKDSDIQKADLIIMGTDADDGFKYANTTYGLIRGSSGTGSYSNSNDITFAQAVAIYKKVINEETAIACPTVFNTVGGQAGQINLGRLYQMLYCIVNDDIEKESIVVDTYEIPKELKIKKQGKDNNYWKVDETYQAAVPSKVMVLGSGRDIFRDYLKSMSSDALSKPLYESGELKTPTTEYVYIEESGTNAGSIIVKPKNGDIDGYTFNNSKGDTIPTWGVTFDNNFLRVNTNMYLMDRYRVSEGWYKNEAPVWNSEYNHFYKFRYEGPSSDGIYRNQIVWNNHSGLLHFDKSGASGILAIQTARNNTKGGSNSLKADIIGTINYVGADLQAAGDERRASQGDTTSKQFSSMPDYSMKIVDLPEYTSDPSKPGSAITRKVLYMTEDQFEEAQRTGLFLYVLIKTSKDPSNYNKCVLWYEKNEMDASGKPEKGRVDYKDFDYGLDNIENHENCIKYAPGVRVDEAYVREYRYHVPAEYFQHLVPPYNNKNNMIVAKIDKSATRQYEGNDTLYIYIRDTFDLD